jgi:hypothetical protein
MVVVERVQTGVRMERNLLKVLKGLAEYLDVSLSELLEGIVLHAFAARAPFGESTIEIIGDLKRVYGLTLTAPESHELTEKETAPKQTPALSSGTTRPPRPA